MVLRAASVPDGLQEAMEDLGREVPGGFHLAGQPVNVAVDRWLIFVVDSSQRGPVAGPRAPQVRLIAIAHHSSLSYKTQEIGKGYGFNPKLSGPAFRLGAGKTSPDNAVE
jgi:hypothetical protein